MSGTPFSTGQLGKLQREVTIAVATALPNVAAKFRDPKPVLKALEGRDEVFAGHLEVALEQAIKRMMVLVHRGRASLTTSARYDSSSLQTREGLWVYGGYTKLVGSEVKPVEAGTTFNFDIYEIGTEDGATDADVEGALPSKHLFEETALNAIIAEAVATQPNGGPGKFPTDRLILLYTSSCVVYFSWDPDRRGWDVITWRRDDDAWDAGSFVLSPAN